jgi:hypothetical protein
MSAEDYFNVGGSDTFIDPFGILSGSPSAIEPEDASSVETLNLSTASSSLVSTIRLEEYALLSFIDVDLH